MTKLYISYYGKYISIVEGYYNIKKNKYKILNSAYLDLEAYGTDLNSMQNQINKVLNEKRFKSKDVVLCISTPDVICKKISIPKVDFKDLNGILENGLEEFVHVDRDENYYSYEVIGEKNFDGKVFLDVAIGAVSKVVIHEVISLIKNAKLKLQCIDILPISCGRIINEVESKSMMIVNSGSCGTIVTIYKENSLFTYEYISTKLNESNEYDYMTMLEVLEEVRGLMTYYSSRNFGNTVEDILLIGEITKYKNIKEDFEEIFKSNILVGVNDLFNIKEEIICNLHDVNLYVENLGMMKRNNNKTSYPSIDLSPQKLKDLREKNKKKKRNMILILFAFILSMIPSIFINITIDKEYNKLNNLQQEMNQMKEEASIIDELEQKIKLKQQELEQYDMLFENKITWKKLLLQIDKKVPLKMEINEMNFTYENISKDNIKEDGKDENILDQVVNDALDSYVPSESESEKNKEEKEDVPIYKQIPNSITINGKAKSPDIVGQFVYELNKMGYFENIKLNNVTEQSSDDSKTYSFDIVMKIQKEVIKFE